MQLSKTEKAFLARALYHYIQMVDYTTSAGGIREGHSKKEVSELLKGEMVQAQTIRNRLLDRKPVSEDISEFWG